MNSTPLPRPNHIPLIDLAKTVQATISGPENILISGLSHLEGASTNDLSFVINPQFYEAARQSRAAAFLTKDHIPGDPRPQIITPNPLMAMATLAQRFFLPPLPARGIHSTAVTGQDVRIGPEVSIGPLVTINDRAQIGARVTIYAGVHIEEDAVIGDDCILYPQVSVLANCVLGNRVILHCGTVIGSDGFGYVQDQGQHHKIPQTGNVIIEDDVEIGANVTVDRATFGSTRIGPGTKVDNQVQIAHNVVIGAHCIIVAQVGIAGSTTLGDHVVVGGQAGFSGHLTVGDQVTIASRTGVTKNIKSGQIVGGFPAVDHNLWRKSQVLQYQLPDMRKELRKLQKEVEDLKKLLKQDQPSSNP